MIVPAAQINLNAGDTGFDQLASLQACPAEISGRAVLPQQAGRLIAKIEDLLAALVGHQVKCLAVDFRMRRGGVGMFGLLLPVEILHEAGPEIVLHGIKELLPAADSQIVNAA